MWRSRPGLRRYFNTVTVKIVDKKDGSHSTNDVDDGDNLPARRMSKVWRGDSDIKKSKRGQRALVHYLLLTRIVESPGIVISFLN